MALLKSLLIGVVLLSLTGDASSFGFEVPHSEYAGRVELVQGLIDFYPLLKTVAGMYGQSLDVDFTIFLPLLETVNLEYWNNVDIKNFAKFFKLPTPEAETILDFFNNLHGKSNKYQAKKMFKKILSEVIPKLVKKVANEGL